MSRACRSTTPASWVRRSFAELIGADAREVAVTTSVSAGVSALASAFRFDGERRTIVVSDFEFPTTWRDWCRPPRTSVP